MDTIIEAPDPIEGNEEPVQPETAETVSGGEGQPEEVQAPVEEPTIEFQGQKLTSAQLQEALEALKNKIDWQKANTQKAQENAEMRRQFEKDQQELLFLKQRLDQNPQLLQQIFAPQQARNLESELQEHYARRPADPYSQEYVQWEFQKDSLNREIARRDALRESQSMLVQTSAQEKNLSIERSAKEKYKGKVSEEEFLDMAKWIVQNVQPRNGVYPDNAFDIAYRNTYMDKEIEAIKLEVSKRATESMTKAKPSSEAGLQKPYDKLTPEEQEDLEFVQRINMGKRK